MPSSRQKPLLITPGEPAGIGPDICIVLAQKTIKYRLVVVADPELLHERAEKLNLPLTLTEFQISNDPGPSVGQLEVVPVARSDKVENGRLNRANAGYVLRTLDKAVELCVTGDGAALITGPVHKGVINEAGISFTGHTEYLADLTGGYPVMMLATPGLRVALATTHLPLVDVSKTITKRLLRQVIEILSKDLETRFSIEKPTILVCGLNPHAGEDGHLGSEEIEIINPVLTSLRKEGMNLIGPLPADTIFNPDRLEQADAILAMYHDQGLPVLKYKGFGNAVNVTLGLPIIRTSVDHGTALEIAGTGQADKGSLEYAIEVAAQMAGLSSQTV